MYRHLPRIEDNVAEATKDIALRAPELLLASAKRYLKREDPFLWRMEFLHYQRRDTIASIHNQDPEQFLQEHPLMMTGAARTRLPVRRYEMFTLGKSYLVDALNAQHRVTCPEAILPVVDYLTWRDAEELCGKNTIEHGQAAMRDRNPSLFYGLMLLADVYGVPMFKWQAWRLYGLLDIVRQNPRICPPAESQLHVN